MEKVFKNGMWDILFYNIFYPAREVTAIQKKKFHADDLALDRSFSSVVD